MTIIVRAEVRVPIDNLDAFRALATQLARATEDEPGTVQYRWFSSDDPSKFVVIEEYLDEGAAFAHNQHCAELLDQAGSVSEFMNVQIHGELGAVLVRWIGENPQAKGLRPFT